MVRMPLQPVAEVQAAQFGLKLGGLMLKEEEAAAHANASRSDDEEMKIPPNVKELVAEELGLLIVLAKSLGRPGLPRVRSTCVAPKIPCFPHGPKTWGKTQSLA
jgi:hypothetical protein